MSNVSEYAEGLVEEGLNEAAHTFFGARKRLEDEMALFHTTCHELRLIGQQVLDWAHGLGFVLLEGEALPAFYDAIGVDSHLDTLKGSRCPHNMRLSRCLFRSTRYWKTVYRIYGELCHALDVYTNGRHYDDPGRPGRKKRTICLVTLRQWGERINKQVLAVNKDHEVSQVLQFAKQFRGDEVEKEKITGAGLRYDLDEELSFSPVDLAQCGFLSFPALPDPCRVRSRIKSFSLQVYKNHTARLLDILNHIQQP
ncbi:MAG: hypothetical protein CSA21_07205 [Deltaproteobacteria bacterium]|nr:MAG: hypothetical protein CSA21_07205 [Deltaproteobacteria bacterium]